MKRSSSFKKHNTGRTYENFQGYRLVEQINETRGSFFHRAVREKNAETVILQRLKVLEPGHTETAVLKQEFKILTGLDQRHIIKHIELIEQKDAITLVLEDFKGISVSDLISRAPLTTEIFLDIAVQLSRAFGELHQIDIVHGSVTSDHILIDMKSGEVKLTGFGFISQFTRENEAIYEEEVILKALAYISPEQTGRMNRTIDYRTDLYSLGICFYHMITGQVPFIEHHPMMMFHAHIAKQPVSPDEIIASIPPVISEIILKLLKKTPEERYQNSFGLMADLERCQSEYKKTGKIQLFDIGHQDISKRFNIPQKLYGREEEIEKLLSSYDRICIGGKEVMLIAGPPGIGKTALIRELDKAIVAKNGYFISGKYEQLRKDVPLSALIQAIMGLVRDMLSESQRKISVWKDMILNAVGNNGRVITDMIPELELIIGEQPDVVKLNPEETKNRFNFVLERFMETIATPDHPVVLFLDDLQWADLVSFELIERLCNNPAIRYLFIIGSYRDNDVHSSTSLASMISAVESSGVLLQVITLDVLNEFNIRQLLVDFLKTSHEKSSYLASLIHEKTGGNPFFVSQFLKKLFELEYIVSDSESGWKWDNETLSGMQVTDNLVEFLVDKISQLPDETIKILKICSCVGNRFDLDMISLVANQTLDVVLPKINQTIREGLIGKTSDFYVFHHDRIQEAAYSMISDAEKANYHYRIGRIELDRNDSEQLKKKLFYIVDQLKTGRDDFPDEKEKYEFIRLTLEAGRKAKTATAYSQASNYLNTGISFLAHDSWAHEHALTFDLHRELLECLYLTGDFEEAERLYELALSKTQSISEVSDLSSLVIILYTSQGDFEKAMKVGFQAIKLIGYPLPRKTNEIRVVFALLRLLITLKGRKIDDIANLPEIKDPMVISFGNLFINLGTVVYYSNPNLFALLVIEGNIITFKHGLWEMSDYSLTALASILGSAAGFYSLGHRIGHTALSISDLRPGHTNRCRINFLFGMVILPWVRHAAETIEYFKKAYTYGIECGDRLFASHSINLICHYRLISGHSLTGTLEDYEVFKDFLLSGKDPFVKSSYIENTRMILCLKGELSEVGSLDGQDFKEKEQKAFYVNSKNDLGLFYFLCIILRLRYLYGKYEEAFSVSEELKALMKMKVGSGCLHNGEIIFYRSLTLTALYENVGVIDKLRFRSEIRQNQKKMKTWAKNSPDNFLHKYLLVKAELLKIGKKHARAAYTYRVALKTAAESGYSNIEAVTNECYARFWLSNGYRDIAGFYFKEACKCYRKYDAAGKAVHLVSLYPDLMSTEEFSCTGSGLTNKISNALDLTTIISASQAISSEIRLDRLLSAMLKYSMENAGAERGFIILENNGNLYVEAERDSDSGDEPKTEGPIHLDEHDGLSKAIVNYTVRTKEILLLDNAAVFGNFTRDPYVVKCLPKSVLCLPVLNQGRLSAVIYFENNQTTKAFNQERVELVKILASQAAIAIDNSRLYEKMEEKIRARTEALNDALNDVKESNKRTIDSISYASLIQQTMLPDRSSMKKILPESFVIWQPREIIGGDMYYFARSGNNFVLGVFDCTGHGVPGALMTMLTVSGLKMIVHDENEYDPSVILKKLNRYIKTTLRQDRDGCNSDSGLDAGVLFWNNDERTLLFSGARLHLYSIQYNTMTVVKGDRHSIGYAASDIDFRFSLHKLEDVDDKVFYLATDGYVDQLGGTKRTRLGSRSFKEIILSLHKKSFDEQKEALTNFLNRHRGAESYTDDITLIGFRVSL